MPLIREVMTMTIPIVPWVGGKRRLAEVLTPRFFCAHRAATLRSSRAPRCSSLCGHQRRSKSWENVRLSVPLEGRCIRAVQFVGQNGWIVSAAGTVVNTIDGGKTCSFQADTLMDARRMQLMRATGGFWAPTSFEMFGDVYDTKDGGLN